eukprot:3764276-Heterocapsa_arctica.AAC.1
MRFQEEGAACHAQAPGRPRPRAGQNQFGDMVSADHVVLAQPNAGLQGERAGLVVFDMGTENLLFFPTRRKTFQACAQSL